MGTARGLILLHNRGFSRPELEACLAGRPAPCGHKALLARLTGTGDRAPELLAFREDARWLPYFQSWRCESCLCSSRDLRELSQRFGTPVLGFSIFDSDVLFLSYCDAAKQVFYDYVKPNFPEMMEDFDAPDAQTGPPVFLLSLAGYGGAGQEEGLRRLTDIWEEELVFADDRMDGLLQFLGAQVIYDEEEIPEGYLPIRS